jgi:hypothetical protein
MVLVAGTTEVQLAEAGHDSELEWQLVLQLCMLALCLQPYLKLLVQINKEVKRNPINMFPALALMGALF